MCMCCDLGILLAPPPRSRTVVPLPQARRRARPPPTVSTTRRFTRFDFDMDTSSGGRAEERAPDYSYSISDGLLTFLSVMAPTLVLNLAFSVAGFGDVTYLFLEDLKYPWYAAADACLLLCLLLWMLDAHRWTKSYMVVVRRLCIALAVLLAAVACSLATRVYPFAPLQLGVSTPRRLLQQGRLTPVTVVESLALRLLRDPRLRLCRPARPRHPPARSSVHARPEQARRRRRSDLRRPMQMSCCFSPTFTLYPPSPPPPSPTPPSPAI